MLKKVFLLLIKYMPIIQMVAMLVNNTMYCFDVYTKMYYLLGYLTGNSLLTTVLLYACSSVFKFGNWYRQIVTANFVVMTIGQIDIHLRLPMTDFQLLLSYYIVCILFLFIIVINKFKSKESCI